MLTIFALPKPFRAHIGLIQRNAIGSWARLRPRPEVLLLGDEEGTAGEAVRVGARHHPDVPRTQSGVPRVDGVFRLGQELADTPLVCYVNCDIVLPSAFGKAVEALSAWSRPALLVGRRHLLDVTAPIDFADASWEERLLTDARVRGRLDRWSAVDYFVFPRGAYRDVPPFAIGRGAWDDWLLSRAVEAGLPIIDATPDVPVVHQNHDYTHGGGAETVWKGADAQRNRALAGPSHLCSIADASWVLRGGRIRPALGLPYVWRRGFHAARRSRFGGPLHHVMGALQRATRPLRSGGG